MFGLSPVIKLERKKERKRIMSKQMSEFTDFG